MHRLSLGLFNILGDPGHSGVVGALGRNTVIFGATDSEVLPEEHQSQHPQGEQHDAEQGLKPLLISSDRSSQLYQSEYFRW